MTVIINIKNHERECLDFNGNVIDPKTKQILKKKEETVISAEEIERAILATKDHKDE